MNTKTALIISAIIAFLLLLVNRSKAATANKIFGFKADWSIPKFDFTHPDLGRHTLIRPSAQDGFYNLLKHTNALQLGWTQVPGNKIVVTLVHLQDSIFSEIYVLDLNAQSAEYTREMQQVTAQG